MKQQAADQDQEDCALSGGDPVKLETLDAARSELQRLQKRQDRVLNKQAEVEACLTKVERERAIVCSRARSLFTSKQLQADFAGKPPSCMQWLMTASILAHAG